MNPEAALSEYKHKADAKLSKYFEQKIEEATHTSPFAADITQQLADFTLGGGKRFRAALIYYAYKLFGGSDEDAIISLSLFIELLQSFLLIHDDIMDRSVLRRGHPTIHKVYEAYSQQHELHDDSHFGLTMAILCGDLANQLALGIVGESPFPADYKSKLVSLISEEVTKVCFGQQQDILLDYNIPSTYTKEDILALYRNKTATYTFKLPLFAGALLAGASEEALRALEGFAIPSGIAYQIRDDVLGVFGKSEETGKPVTDDLTEGKKTILVTSAYQHANHEQREQLNHLLGNKELTEAEADTIRSIFIDTGALEYAKFIAEEHVFAAKTSLETLSNKESESYGFLTGVADYILIRDL